MRVLNLVLCFIVIGLLVGCQSFQSQYINMMKQHPEYPYFALAESISGNYPVAAVGSFSRARANADAIDTCMSTSKGEQCYVTYENSNFVGQNVYQERKERPERIRQQVEQAKQQEYLNKLKNICSGYGFTPGTNNFANCMMNQDQIVRNQNELDRQNELLRAKMLLDYSNSLRPQPAPQTNCQTTYMGAIAQTRCY